MVLFSRGRNNANTDNGSSDSSSELYSLLKSSDEYTLTTGGDSTANNSSAENEGGATKDPEVASSSSPPRPVLQEPFWNQEADLTPEVIFGYQVKTRDIVETLRDDMERLKKMYQPSLVNEQMRQLYAEIEEKGEVMKYT